MLLFFYAVFLLLFIVKVFFHSSLFVFLCCCYVVFYVFLLFFMLFFCCFDVVFLCFFLSACSAISIDTTLRCKCLSRLNMVVRLHVGADDILTKENFSIWCSKVEDAITGYMQDQQDSAIKIK